jgi:hypothetical protein
VGELERQLLEWEELNDITLHCEHEVLGTRESTLNHREADLDIEWKANELNADSREADLRDQEASLVARERQLMEQQMQELAVTWKGLEDL